MGYMDNCLTYHCGVYVKGHHWSAMLEYGPCHGCDNLPNGHPDKGRKSMVKCTNMFNWDHHNMVRSSETKKCNSFWAPWGRKILHRGASKITKCAFPSADARRRRAPESSHTFSTTFGGIKGWVEDYLRLYPNYFVGHFDCQTFEKKLYEALTDRKEDTPGLEGIR